MDVNMDSGLKRIYAFAVDFLIAAIVQAFGFLCIIMFFIKSGHLVLLLLLWTGIVSFLIIGKDVFGGQSIGKRVFKICVREEINVTIVPNVKKLLLRNLSIIIWPVEAYFFFSSNKTTRLGDKLFKTVVVSNVDNN